MTEITTNPILHIAITFGIFLFAKWLQKLTGKLWMNPILITIAVLMIFLKVTGISYDTYSQAGDMISFWQKPAIVAMGVPLYLHLANIRRQIWAILVSQLVGCVIGIVSVCLVARMMGASDEVIISLAPKSVTTPIAMEVCSSLGGIPSLTAAIVVCVGLFGAIFGFRILQIGRIRRVDSRGISMGTATHAMGTSRAMEESDECGAFSSLGLILNGVLTAVLTPYIIMAFLS